MEPGIGIWEGAPRGAALAQRQDGGGPRGQGGPAKRIGALGEDMAARYLESEGYEVVARNWRCPMGEVDIVARGSDPRQAILVEVKTRRVPEVGAPVAPELAVGPKKRARYRTMALVYLSLNSEVCSVRFDVVGVGIAPTGESKVRHLADAFGWDDAL